MCSTFIQEVFVYPQVVVSILTLLDGVLQELFLSYHHIVYVKGSSLHGHDETDEHDMPPQLAGSKTGSRRCSGSSFFKCSLAFTS